MMNKRRHRNNFVDEIVDTLTRAIQSQTYSPGSQLPSVERLAEELGAGRTTVREALRVLQTRGFVEIIHGAGTFVRHQPITLVTGQVLSFTEMVRERGMRPSSVILQQDVVKADADHANKLKLALDAPIYQLRRLRLADDVPVSVETSVLSQERFPNLFEQNWTAQTSLYDLLRDHYTTQTRYSEQTVRAVPAGRTESQLLGIEFKSPVLLVENLTFDGTGTPVEFGRSYYSSTRFEYRVVVKPDAP
jgi:GntR family transcriptional regulator